MGGVLPSRILVHTATPVQYAESSSPDPADWVEGEPGEGVEPDQGVPFRCVLFLPGPGGDQPNPYRPRAVSTPTLLYNPSRDDDTPIVIRNEDELLIEAPELAAWTGGEIVRWQAVGNAQPFGPPGRVLGIMASVRAVKD